MITSYSYRNKAMYNSGLAGNAKGEYKLRRANVVYGSLSLQYYLRLTSSGPYLYLAMGSLYSLLKLSINWQNSNTQTILSSRVQYLRNCVYTRSLDKY